mgnify:FL=1
MEKREQKNGTGVAFDNKKSNEKQPDIKGNFLTPSGENLSLSIWIRTSEKGNKYYSISVQEPYEKKETTTDYQTESPKQDVKPKSQPRVSPQELAQVDDTDLPF